MRSILEENRDSGYKNKYDRLYSILSYKKTSGIYSPVGYWHDTILRTNYYNIWPFYSKRYFGIEDI